LIAGFFAIEGTTDSTFTTHRGFFALMLLGMILGNVKQEKQALAKV
jgi:mannose/fructose/N-acetylgalactosamine-specific phosphotransferase system component IIC